MIISTVRIQPSPNKLRETLEILYWLQAPTIAQPGCALRRVCLEQSPELAVILWEEWETETDLKRHVRSELYSWVLAAQELSARAPEIAFYGIAETRGIELIQELRACRSNGARTSPSIRGALDECL